MAVANMSINKTIIATNSNVFQQRADNGFILQPAATLRNDLSTILEICNYLAFFATKEQSHCFWGLYPIVVALQEMVLTPHNYRRLNNRMEVSGPLLPT